MANGQPHDFEWSTRQMTVGKLAADYDYIDVHWLDQGKHLDVGPT